MTVPQYKIHSVGLEEYKYYLNYVDVLDSCKFYSSGKSGDFELRMLITREKGGLSIKDLNLGFGVWNEETKDIDDGIETKNGDMQQILATVANRALEFLARYPEAEIFAKGSTASRTRLYQMEIAKIIDEVPEGLRIEGLISQGSIGFVDFRKGINFDAFLLSAK
ncbi:DUF6934 family protein [Dyadobacter psychrotolerans]|uniref:Uncharacterized protein n=1 Tax=Dyadobacter psychrotolerans TaxID=2541721 RepID=A0A4R5D9P7_9BACT|nr:hypothetical protein [Dyadobacter psychrotolerans]TDE08660.1 hypothetical protein E0F88_32030 [Dyadobacter psychrotolerans]